MNLNTKCSNCQKQPPTGMILSPLGWLCEDCFRIYSSYSSISKGKVRRAAIKVFNRTRQELLIEKGEQVLDDLLVEKIMREGKPVEGKKVNAWFTPDCRIWSA